MESVEKIPMDRIGVLGPHDRINYGDFLFPKMLEYSMSTLFNQKIELKKYSLISADFSYLGAFKTQKFKALTSDINNNEIDIIIVSGGESLSAKWSNLYSYINPLYDLFYQNKNIKNNRIFRNIPKLLLGNKTEYPFIIDKINYKTTDFKVIYHAVGGGENLNTSQIKTLTDSSLVGLRESRSYNHIINKSNSKNIHLVPDSAIIISDVYPLKTLEKKIQGDYVFFQLSHYKHQNKIQEVIQQLRKLSEKEHQIVLCPIGTAKGHEDHIILERIYKEIKNEKIIFIDKQPTINDIISYIAHSKLYIGTSLHGVITSMSYGIPYIALNPNQSKLVSFLNTWSIPELNFIYDTDKFSANLDYYFKNDFKDKINIHTDFLKTKYYEFVDEIIKYIM